MEKFHKKYSYFLLIFILIFAIIFCIIASIVYFTNNYNEKNKVYTTAKISRIEETNDENSTESTHVTYVTYNVGKKKYEAKINYYDPTYKVGQELNIYYYKDDNTKAGTKKGDNISKACFIISIVILAFAIIALIAKRRGETKEKRKHAKIQKENLITVKAKYVETVINSKTIVFGTHPYNIICEWRNPIDKKRYRFTSGDLWRSPQRKILEKSITSFEVHIDKTNINNYQVIIPEILK